MPEGHNIVHLAYSAMGNDLAVADSGGRLMLYTTGFTLGSMMPVHTALNDSSDEMNSIVGLPWLPVFPHPQKVYWTFFVNHGTAPGLLATFIEDPDRQQATTVPWSVSLTILFI